MLQMQIPEWALGVEAGEAAWVFAGACRGQRGGRGKKLLPLSSGPFLLGGCFFFCFFFSPAWMERGIQDQMGWCLKIALRTSGGPGQRMGPRGIDQASSQCVLGFGRL